MKHIYRYLLLFTIAPLCVANEESYYQCQTDKGVVFSQFPCAKDAQKKTIKVYYPRGDDKNLRLPNNTIDRVNKEQRIRVIESQIKGTKSKIRAYKREKNVKYREAELKLNRLMSAEERTELAKQVKFEQQEIISSYDKMVAKQEDELKRLQSELKSWQKQ